MRRMLLTLMAAITLIATSAAAQPMRVEDLVADATTICEGQVRSLESAWDADRHVIYSTVEIAVDETYKGALSNRTNERGGVLRLRLLGGVVGDIGLAIPHQAAFAPDERVILFLGRNTQSLFPLIGDEQGKLTVIADASSGESVIRERSISRVELVQEILRNVRER